MTLRLAAAALACCLVACCLVACSTPPAPTAPASPTPASPTLAEGLGWRVTADDFRAHLRDESPLTRGEFSAPAKKRAGLDQLVDEAVLVAEARRQKLDEDPVYQAQVRALLAARLVAAHAKDAPPPTPTDNEVFMAYTQQADRYRQPERARVQVLMVKGLPNTPELAQKQKALESARARLAPKSGTKEGEAAFAAEVRAHGEEAGLAASGGDLSLRSRDELTALLGPAVATAAFGLTRPGELSTPVEVMGGLVLLRLVERADPAPVPFEQVRGQVMAELAMSRRQQAQAAWVQQLRQAAQVKVHDDALAAFDPTAVTSPPPPAPAAPAGAGTQGK